MDRDNGFGCGLGLAITGLAFAGFFAYIAWNRDEAPPSANANPAQTETSPPVQPRANITEPEPEQPPHKEPTLAEREILRELKTLGDGIVHQIRIAVEKENRDQINVGVVRSDLIRQANNVTTPYLGELYLQFRHRNRNVSGVIKVSFSYRLTPNDRHAWVKDRAVAEDYQIESVHESVRASDQAYWVAVHTKLLETALQNQLTQSERVTANNASIVPQVASVAPSFQSTDITLPPAPGQAGFKPAQTPSFTEAEKSAARVRFDWLAARFKASFNVALARIQHRTANEPNPEQRAAVLDQLRSFIQSTTITREQYPKPFEGMTADDCIMVINGTGKWSRNRLVVALVRRNNKWMVAQVYDGVAEADRLITFIVEEAIKMADAE